MEILNAAQKKRTLLLVTDGTEVFHTMAEMLSHDYKVVLTDNSDRDYGKIKQQTGPVSGVIVTPEEAAAEDFGLFRWIASDSLIGEIPLLICCTDPAELPLAMECVRRGAVDVLMPPFYEELLLHQVGNAIRLKDSATFYEIERMLRELPSNIYLKDAEGRYIFATHYWHHLEHPDDPDWTIRGKTDVEIRKDRENAIKAQAADMELLRTGIGTAYTIEINEDGIREFLEIIKQPVRNDAGEITGIIGLINNVTERELLRISLEESAMIDEMTGVYNRRFFEQYTAQLERDGQRPISFISADCNDLKYINDTYGHLVGDEYIRMSTLLFRMIVQSNGRIFRVGGDEFVMVLPGRTKAEAEVLVEKLREEERNFRVKNRRLSIAYGISCMERGDEAILPALDAADQAMYRNKAEIKALRVLNG